ncbi:hypothetical protein F7725_016770, partial [Dissostichus mawsoni]
MCLVSVTGTSCGDDSFCSESVTNAPFRTTRETPIDSEAMALTASLSESRLSLRLCACRKQGERTEGEEEKRKIKGLGSGSVLSSAVLTLNLDDSLQRLDGVLTGLLVQHGLGQRLHLGEGRPPSDDKCPSTASKPADTSTTSGENSWAMGITTALRGNRGNNKLSNKRSILQYVHSSPVAWLKQD